MEKILFLFMMIGMKWFDNPNLAPFLVKFNNKWLIPSLDYFENYLHIFNLYTMKILFILQYAQNIAILKFSVN